MTTLTDTVKRMLDALAYADAGEFLSSRQKSCQMAHAKVQEVTTPIIAATENRSIKARQQVAFYMGSEVPADVMNYIVQTCARLNHGLTVLSFQPESLTRAVLNPYLDDIKSAGISMQLVTLSGDPMPGLTRYLRRHPEVAFLACKETGYLGRSFLNGTQRQNALPVPVVLVESHDSNTRSLDSTLPEQNAANINVA